MKRTRVGIACSKHGYQPFENCPHCEEERKSEVNSPSIIIFKPMVYEDICETPLLIESKRQLREECKKHGVIAARLL